jgi:hypothetical protein
VIELKNIILRRVSIFEFSHSQGQTEKFGRANGKSALTSRTDIVSPGLSGPKSADFVAKVGCC